MDYKVQFSGKADNVAKAMEAMNDFDSILPAPKDFRLNKLDVKTDNENIPKAIAIIEDYFYYLLSERGDISKEQGQKTLERYEKEIEGVDKSLVSCYRYLSEWMLEDYDKYGSITLEAWKQKCWGAKEQPKIKTCENGQITICNVQSISHSIIDAVCALCNVTAEITD
ncbi:hypothetical protein [Prevotella disiens]|uniref:Uncharacterized protein n=1 Tax=Prevotella disiens DNF00882 TaxID=1401075 RepID=A0A096C5Y5_9BACT|nr:hypothetical protein [Prevotella disiens]KGF50337.1 hypothetical protein HMPREF0654_01245 [Prevotella disiens DNF00882]